MGHKFSIQQVLSFKKDALLLTVNWVTFCFENNKCN